MKLWVCLGMVLSVVGLASGQELLSNGQFEEGVTTDPWNASAASPDGWMRQQSSGWALWEKVGEAQNPWSDSPPISGSAHSGDHYLGVGAWGDDGSYGQFYQDVPASEGIVYVLRSWVRAGSGWGSPQMGRMKLQFRDSAGNQLLENYRLVAGTDVWTELSLTSDAAPAGTDHVRVILWGMNMKHVNYDDASLVVDDRYVVANPSPFDQQTDVDPSTTLTWDAPSEVASPLFDVWFGSHSTNLTQVANDIANAHYTPSGLQLDTEYFWRVDVVNGQAGPLWSFRTAGGATTPAPGDGAFGVDLDCTLSWNAPGVSGSTPEYSVYFGEQGQPLTLVASHLGSTSYTLPESLEDDSDYQWRVDVTLPGYPTCTGDVWTFSTRDQYQLDVYILSGQSNAAGLGEIGDLVPPLSEEQTDVRIYCNGQWSNLAPGFGNASYYFGPELVFGRNMADANPHRRIGIIKYAVGGMSLETFFTPPSSDGPGEGYTNLVNTVRDALTALEGEADARICGMIWAQGEAESSGDVQLAVGYETNLRHLIEDLRAEFSDVSVPAFPFVAAHVKHVSPWVYANYVNECIDQVLLSTPNVATFDVNDLESHDDAGAHYNTQGQQILGARFATAMQGLEPVDCDYNNDGWVDLADYEAFASCCIGPENEPVDRRCLDVFDSDRDQDVDLKDFAVFQVVFRPKVLIPADHDNIHYLGRNVFTDPSAPQLTWPGAGLMATFEGTTCEISLNDTGDNYFAVVIDGDVKVINCVPGSHVYRVAENLPAGEHTFLLHKRTEGSNGAVGFEGFSLDGSSSLVEPDVPSLKMEVYGDSISVGLALDSPADDQTAPFRNNYLSYGAVTARAIGAEYRVIAVSGIGIETSWWEEDMVHNYWYRHDFSNGSSQWDFNQWQADIVVVNLGQNDYWRSTPTAQAAQGYYVNFGQLLREKYPDAIIIFALGSMNATQSGSPWPGYIEAAVNTLNTTYNDSNVYSIIFPYDGLGTHPHAPQHAANAAQLTSLIESILEPR